MPITNAKRKEIRALRRAAGLCTYCKNAVVPAYSLCEKHIIKVRQAMRKHSGTRSPRSADGAWKGLKLTPEYVRPTKSLIQTSGDWDELLAKRGLK